jgi:type I restriction enzyme S subunit
LETSAFVTKLAGFEYTNFVKYDPDGDLRVLKAENASPRGFKPTAYSRVRSETVSHLNRSKIRGNDVLMVFVGAGLGQVARVPADGEYFLGPNIALIRVDEASCDPGFIEYYLRSPLGFRLANNRAKATAQGSISMAEIRLITCPIPPLSERMRIVIEIERILSITDSIEQQLAALVLRSDRLRHSVLSSAFTGQLVPQDPTDEPASALLERIRAGRVESSRKAVARKAVKKRGKR